jgi:hypothetical protein
MRRTMLPVMSLTRRLAGTCLAVVMLVGCWSSADGSMSVEQRAWCRANATTTVFNAGLSLGYSSQELTVMFDDKNESDWARTEQDARYIRACLSAYSAR